MLRPIRHVNDTCIHNLKLKYLASFFHTSTRQNVYLREPEDLLRRIGPKRRRKVQRAHDLWVEKAESIAGGKEPSMMKILEDRGYIKEVAGDRAALDALMTRKRIGVYMGIDPTSSSLHVGHLVPFMALHLMHMHGFFAVTLLGAATAKFGDPTGRDKERQPKKMSKATADMTMMHLQLKRLCKGVCKYGEQYGFKEEYEKRRTLERNSIWHNKVPVLEFTKAVKGVRLGNLLSRDTVKARMSSEKGMSFGEFMYPLLQGYDWWHMHQRMGVRVQIGGADQYGNILTGMEVVKHAKMTNPDREVREAKDWLPYGFTTPLLTTPSGEKFGKSEDNAIWLDKDRTPTFYFYQYFMRLPDSSMETLLKLLTFIPLPEIASLLKEHNTDPSKRIAQHRLAYDVTMLVHGKVAADLTKARHQSIFNNGPTTIPSDATDLPGKKATNGKDGKVQPATWETSPVARAVLPRSLVIDQPFSRILYSAGFVQSRLEGQRLVNQQGAYVGSRPGQKGNMQPDVLHFTPIKSSYPEETKDYLIDGELLILRQGKWKVKIINVVSDKEFAKMGITDVPLWDEVSPKLKLNNREKEDAKGSIGEENEKKIDSDRKV